MRKIIDTRSDADRFDFFQFCFFKDGIVILIVRMVHRTELICRNNGIDGSRQKTMDIGCTDRAGTDQIKGGCPCHAIGSGNQGKNAVVIFIGVIFPLRIVLKKHFTVHTLIIQQKSSP